MPHTTTHCECETHWRVWLDQLTLTASSTIHGQDSLVDKQVYLLKPCSPQMTQRMLLVSSSVAYIVETLHLTSDVVDYSLVNFDITPPINKMTYTGWWLGLQLPDDICQIVIDISDVWMRPETVADLSQRSGIIVQSGYSTNVSATWHWVL